MAFKRTLSTDSEPDTPVIIKKINLQTTPVKLTEINEGITLSKTMASTIEQADRNKAIKALKSEAPSWLAHVFDFLLKDLDYICSQSEGLGAVTKKCDDNSNEIENLQKRVVDLELENKLLHNQVNKLENYSRKENLIIKGLAETGPNENTLEVVISFFNHNLKMNDAEKL